MAHKELAIDVEVEGNETMSRMERADGWMDEILEYYGEEAIIAGQFLMARLTHGESLPELVSEASSRYFWKQLLETETLAMLADVDKHVVMIEGPTLGDRVLMCCYGEALRKFADSHGANVIFTEGMITLTPEGQLCDPIYALTEVNLADLIQIGYKKLCGRIPPKTS